MICAAQEDAATSASDFSTFLLVEQFSPAEVGARIASARKQADGMTQEHLADLLGIALRTLQTYEQGERIPWKHLRHIATILNCPVEWLLRGSPEGEEPGEASGVDRLEDIEEKLERLTAAVERLAEDLAASRSDPDDGRSAGTASAT